MNTLESDFGEVQMKENYSFLTTKLLTISRGEPQNVPGMVATQQLGRVGPRPLPTAPQGPSAADVWALRLPRARLGAEAAFHLGRVVVGSSAGTRGFLEHEART